MHASNPSQNAGGRGYPDYLARKLDAFYKGRVEKDWRGRHIMRGLTPQHDAVRLMSNDYLSIANHPHILNAQQQALETADNYTLMSAIFLHGDDPQSRFEARMAEFLNADETVLCQSGYNANVGLIQSIVEDTNTPVYIDTMAHMSLWDGIKMAGLPPRRFRHNNAASLEKQIKRFGPGLVLVDSVYSTNGSTCPLVDLVNTAYNMGCLIIVDESHSLGTHGPEGRGLVYSLGLSGKVAFRTASLAKTFVGRAGMIACPAGFADYFQFTAKPAIFSSALLPHEIAGLDAAMDLIRAGDERRKRLHSNTRYLRRSLRERGYDVAPGDAQIIALEAGDEWGAIVLRDALEKRGIFGSPFCAPATPRNSPLIRLSINAGLSDADLLRIVNACGDIRDEIGTCRRRSTRAATAPA